MRSTAIQHINYRSGSFTGCARYHAPSLRAQRFHINQRLARRCMYRTRHVRRAFLKFSLPRHYLLRIPIYLR
jgi:hypothetical protein